MANITYLLGAGASCKVLPVVKDIPTRLYWFKTHLEHVTKHFEIDCSTLLSAIDWLISEAEKHASIDTFAKKLYLQNNIKDLNRLKSIMILFFLHEQFDVAEPLRHSDLFSSKKTVDVRYDTFFASVLNKEKKLPSNLQILSWNYDFQLEKAYSVFCGDFYLQTIQDKLNVYPRYKDSPSLNINESCVFKLNGTTVFREITRDGEDEFTIGDMEKIIDEDFIQWMLKNYSSSTDFHNPYTRQKFGLHFAWEEDEESQTIIQQAMERTKDTDTLVVVGYSFPFFNREIDRKIIRNMNGLKKVYFQSGNEEEAEKYRLRFRSIRHEIENPRYELKTELHSDSDQFFLPPEL